MYRHVSSLGLDYSPVEGENDDRILAILCSNQIIISLDLCPTEPRALIL